MNHPVPDIRRWKRIEDYQRKMSCNRGGCSSNQEKMRFDWMVLEMTIVIHE